MSTQDRLRDQNALPYRLAFAGASALAVVGGHMLWFMESSRAPGPGDPEVDAKFLLFLLGALVPTIIYVVGVRTFAATITAGSLLVGITISGWTIFAVDSTMLGSLGPFLACFVNMLVAAFAALPVDR